MCLERMRGMMGGVRICCFTEGYEGREGGGRTDKVTIPIAFLRRI